MKIFSLTMTSMVSEARRLAVVVVIFKRNRFHSLKHSKNCLAHLLDFSFSIDQSDHDAIRDGLFRAGS